MHVFCYNIFYNNNSNSSRRHASMIIIVIILTLLRFLCTKTEFLDNYCVTTCFCIFFHTAVESNQNNIDITIIISAVSAGIFVTCIIGVLITLSFSSVVRHDSL